MKIPMQWIGAYTPISLEPQSYMDRMIGDRLTPGNHHK